MSSLRKKSSTGPLPRDIEIGHADTHSSGRGGGDGGGNHHHHDHHRHHDHHNHHHDDDHHKHKHARRHVAHAHSAPVMGHNSSLSQIDSKSMDGRSLDPSEDAASTRPFEKSGSIRSIRQDDPNVDELRINRAVQESGVFSFGIVAVEAWLLNEDDGKFVCPDGGSWTSPVLKFMNSSKSALHKIFDPTDPEYLPPLPQIAGTGIAGYFWSHVPDYSGTGPLDKLMWRDLKAVTSDPDQPPSPRMNAMVEAGIGMAAGVPFHVLGRKGIIIYLARNHANEDMLNDDSNNEFLQFSAQYIGAALCMSEPRQVSLESKQARLRRCFHRIVAKVSTMNVLKNLMNDAKSHRIHHTPQVQVEDTPGRWSHIKNAIKDGCSVVKGGIIAGKDAVVSKATTIWLKSRGSHTKPPPSQSFFLSTLAFVGSFSTLCIIFGIGRLFETITSGQYTITLGPLVSLMCAQYALTAAPASQPRNAIFGQLISCGGAFLSRYLLRDLAGFPNWVVGCFAGSLAVFSMAKTGVVHPPAAGAAYFFADGELEFIFFLLVLFGNFVAILMACLINNWTDKRQYPVYWEFGAERVYNHFKERAEARRAEKEAQEHSDSNDDDENSYDDQDENYKNKDVDGPIQVDSGGPVGDMSGGLGGKKDNEEGFHSNGTT